MVRSLNFRALVWLVLLVAALGVGVWRWRGAGRGEFPEGYVARPRGTLTFSGEIGAIVHRHCAECHREGAPGPFALLTYEDVAKRARQIGEVTRKRYMPPWLPEPGHVAYIGERVMSRDDLGMLHQWIAEGAMEGERGRAPAVTAAQTGWRLGRPDLVLRMPEAYRLGAEGPDVYRNFALPTGLTNGQFVRAVEFQPGGRGVHHVRVLLDDSGQCRKLDEAEAGPGFGGWMPPAKFPPGHFVTWTPGKSPTVAGEGLAWRLEAGADVVLQLHLQRSGKEELIQPEVGFYFTNAAPTRRAYAVGLMSRMIDLPAGAASAVVRREIRLPVEVEVLRVMPHAHYLGKRMEAFALLPDGTRRELLRIREWDFNWQDEYRLATPLALPAGTLVRMDYTYDNSAGNPRNPHVPPRRVRHGPQSTDEMGEFWMQVVVRDAESWEALDAAMRVRNAEESVAYFGRRVEEGPLDVAARVELGKSLGALGRQAGAKEQFVRALQLNPELAEALYFLGLTLLNEGDLAGAKGRFEAALRARPGYARAEHGLGLVALQSGQFDEAERLVRSALRMNPDDPLLKLTLERVARERARAAQPGGK